MSGDDLRLFIEAQRASYRGGLPQRIRTVEALCGRLLAGDASIELAIHCGDAGSIRSALEDLMLLAPR